MFPIVRGFKMCFFVLFRGGHCAHLFAGCFVYYKFHIMRLDRYVGVYTYVVLGAEIGVTLFLVYFIVRELRKWYKTRTMYFKVLRHTPNTTQAPGILSWARIIIQVLWLDRKTCILLYPGAQEHLRPMELQ